MDFQQAQNMIQQNNIWSAQQAQKQMDFQREMSNTAHQREVADLKAAGLNPVLSAKLGGASTPNGAMGDTDTSGTSTLIDMMMSSVGAAGSGAQAAAQAVDGITGLVDNVIGMFFGTRKQKVESMQNVNHWIGEHGAEALAGLRNLFGGHNTNSANTAEKENSHSAPAPDWTFSPTYQGHTNRQDMTEDERTYSAYDGLYRRAPWFFKTFYPNAYPWYMDRRRYYQTVFGRGYFHGNGGHIRPNLMSTK